MTQGFVLTQYFYEQLIQFEKEPVGLKDTIGEMVYSMDVEQQTHRARQIEFDKEADADVLQRSKPRKLTGLDLAEARLSEGDLKTAKTLANQALGSESDSLQSVADSARANFILARVDLMSVHPGEPKDDADKTIGEAIAHFRKTLETSKEPRLLAWSHIYLGRMLDLDCKRDDAVAEYKQALESRDGEQDTRLSAERGVKTPYLPKGASCDDDDDSTPPAQPGATPQPPAKPTTPQ
jgi:tetratricopeptide (TPR) repeat protein